MPLKALDQRSQQKGRSGILLLQVPRYSHGVYQPLCRSRASGQLKVVKRFNRSLQDGGLYTWFSVVRLFDLRRERCRQPVIIGNVYSSEQPTNNKLFCHSQLSVTKNKDAKFKN
ncbi:hypothetical protein TNIN_154081 [Trichonephila inaurata madagascariensis]|uniref:Uncharacterized protein n=1 Tax=Trichonephila inaurata madagascariensis TaxID=2747483 RepID=A0A8X6XYC3_9ARAC|nr:hypothetical protein TNIN_154081 [Trichonephila inaurata madagascariensis]